MKTPWTALVTLAVSILAGGTARAAVAPKPDVVHRWNRIAIDASGVDHTPLAPADPRSAYAEQPGPGRASRAMAIVHIAIFDVVSAIEGGYESYTGVTGHERPISLDAAVAQAAHDTLASLYAAQASTFDGLLSQELRRVRNRKQRDHGVDLGARVAAAVLAMRVGDHSEVAEPHVDTDHPTSPLPGHWRQDPVSLHPLALGAHWGECRPFVIGAGSDFRVPPPPDMTSPEYAVAFEEVKRLGGDGDVTQTERTEEQTIIGTYWAYDGTPSLCAPPRLYNQITVTIADQRRLKAVELARLLALVNTAMADAGMAIWDSKYHYDVWRPVTGIRESDPGTGPTGEGDGNDDTDGDASFMPLGAPASNGAGPNFTPPFPSYPSGHAGFGGALFQILRRFFGTDDIAFTFVSDELNGVTRDAQGRVRPLIPRSFRSLSEAEEENGQSRIYLGIHWSFDKTEGIAQGRRVADYVFDHAFRSSGEHATPQEIGTDF
jgi:hypothetical protein